MQRNVSDCGSVHEDRSIGFISSYMQLVNFIADPFCYFVSSKCKQNTLDLD